MKKIYGRCLFACTSLWHWLAAHYFIRHPFHILRCFTHLRPIPFLAADVVRFLGGLNIGYAVLGLGGMLAEGREVRRATALALALANGSQFWFDLTAIADGRVVLMGHFLPIVILDGLFALLHAAYLLMPDDEGDQKTN